MAKKDLPDIETLRQLVRYEPETGKLYWLPRKPDMFQEGKQSKEHNCSAWNTKYSGKEALKAINKKTGYKQGTLFNISVDAHIIAYAIYNGKIPINEIDHINGVRTDNRIINLREATISQQRMNSIVIKPTSSGVRGVNWDKAKNKWFVRITVNRKCKNIGRFTDFDEAVSARKAAEAKYHGEYARVS